MIEQIPTECTYIYVPQNTTATLLLAHTLSPIDTEQEQAGLQEDTGTTRGHTHTQYRRCVIHTEHRSIARDDIYHHAHLAMTDMPPAPRRTAAKERSWSLTLPCSLGPMKSAARRSTSAM